MGEPENDLICVRLSDRGKWHVEERGRTACGEVVPDNLDIPRRFLSIIDSTQRCRSEGCKAARMRAKAVTR